MANDKAQVNRLTLKDQLKLSELMIERKTRFIKMSYEAIAIEATEILKHEYTRANVSSTWEALGWPARRDCRNPSGKSTNVQVQILAKAILCLGADVQRLNADFNITQNSETLKLLAEVRKLS